MMTTRIFVPPFMFIKVQSSLTNYMTSSLIMKHISNMKWRTFPRHLLAPTLPSNHPQKPKPHNQHRPPSYYPQNSINQSCPPFYPNQSHSLLYPNQCCLPIYQNHHPTLPTNLPTTYQPCPYLDKRQLCNHQGHSSKHGSTFKYMP